MKILDVNRRRPFGRSYEVRGAWSWRFACHDAIDWLFDHGTLTYFAFADHWFRLSPGHGRNVPWMAATECSSCGTMTYWSDDPQSLCCIGARRAAFREKAIRS